MDYNIDFVCATSQKSLINAVVLSLDKITSLLMHTFVLSEGGGNISVRIIIQTCVELVMIIRTCCTVSVYDFFSFEKRKKKITLSFINKFNYRVYSVTELETVRSTKCNVSC